MRTGDGPAHTDHTDARVGVIVGGFAGQQHFDLVPLFGLALGVVPQAVAPKGANKLVVGELVLDPAEVRGHEFLLLADEQDAHFAPVEARPVTVRGAVLEEDVHGQGFAGHSRFEVAARDEAHFAVGWGFLE